MGSSSSETVRFFIFFTVAILFGHIKGGFPKRALSPGGARTGSSQSALAVFYCYCREISASRRLSAAEILAILQRRVGENSDDAGCYWLLFAVLLRI
jgi:hypothetical protein